MDEPGRKLWCFFKAERFPRPQLGIYLGGGRVKLLRDNRKAQRELDLERIEYWRPLLEEQIEEAESA